MVVLDESFDPLKDHIKVCDDVVLFIMDEILKFLLNNIYKRFVVGYPRLQLSQKFPIVIFFYYSMRKLPSPIPSETSNQSKKATKCIDFNRLAQGWTSCVFALPKLLEFTIE